MATQVVPEPVTRLIEAFSRLPGIGPKTASRLTFYLLRRPAEQAEALAERLKTDSITAIYVTKLRRTHETAAPLAAHLGIAPIEDPDLHEVHLGDWDGGLYRIKAAEGAPHRPSDEPRGGGRLLHGARRRRRRLDDCSVPGLC